MNPIFISILTELGKIAISEAKIIASQAILFVIEKAFDSIKKDNGQDRKESKN